MATRALVLAALAAVPACRHAYVSMGYDAVKQSRGAVVDGAAATAPTGSLALGVASGMAGIEAHVQSHAETPGDGDRFVMASTSLELRLALVHVGPLGRDVHGGPDRGAVFDTQMEELTWGVGYRAGAGAELAWSGIAVWIDAAREALSFGGDTVNGHGDRDVISVGIRIGG
jgi:hypothetical protein